MYTGVMNEPHTLYTPETIYTLATPLTHDFTRGPRLTLGMPEFDVRVGGPSSTFVRGSNAIMAIWLALYVHTMLKGNALSWSQPPTLTIKCDTFYSPHKFDFYPGCRPSPP